MDDPSIHPLNSGRFELELTEPGAREPGFIEPSVSEPGVGTPTDPGAPAPGVVPGLAAEMELLEGMDRAVGSAHAERARTLVRGLEKCVAHAEATLPPGRRGWDAETVGFREATSEVAATLHLSEMSAGTMIVHAELLVTVFTRTLAALASGDVSYWHTMKLVNEATSLPEAAQLRFEETVLPFAMTLTVAKFEKKARTLRERLHPESITARTSAAFDDRAMWSTDEHDGMATLCVRHKAVVVHAAVERTRSLAKSLTGPDEQRTQSQLQADVIVDLLVDGHTDPYEPDDAASDDTSADADADADAHPHDSTGVVAVIAAGPAFSEGTDGTGGRLVEEVPLTVEELRFRGTACHARGVRAVIQVTVPVFTLMDRQDLAIDGQLPVLEGYGPIDPDTARQLAASAPSFTRLLVHPETGAILSYGKDHYAVPADLKRALSHRDGTCRFPGCNRKPYGCDLDHIIDWQYDGVSDHDNLAHLCKKHHNLKHNTGWRYRHLVGGTLRWTGPSGREYVTEPEHVLTIPGRRPAPPPAVATVRSATEDGPPPF